MSRFLIIGASGFIGSRMHDALLSVADVLGTSTKPDREDRICFDLATDEVLSVLPEAWRDAKGQKFAVLSAAVVPMDRCRTEEAYAREVMIDGSQRCLKDLASVGFTPVFLSTSYIFDGAAGGYKEEDEPNPLGNYGRLKLEMEQWLRANILDHLIVRLDKTVGVDPDESHQFSSWADAMFAAETIRCIEGQEFGLTNVDDVIRMLYLACQNGLRGTYHLANPEPLTRAEIARELAEALDVETEIVESPMEDFNFPEPRPMHSWLNSDKLAGELEERFSSVSEMIQEFAELSE